MASEPEAAVQNEDGRVADAVVETVDIFEQAAQVLKDFHAGEITNFSYGCSELVRNKEKRRVHHLASRGIRIEVFRTKE